MNKTARFVLKTVAAGLAFCAFVCLVVGSWSDVYEAIERRRACRLSKQESRDYADEELYQFSELHKSSEDFSLMARDTLLGFPRTPSLPSRKIYHFIDSLSAHGNPCAALGCKEDRGCSGRRRTVRRGNCHFLRLNGGCKTRKRFFGGYKIKIP